MRVGILGSGLMGGKLGTLFARRGPRGEPGRAAAAGQVGDEDHVDLAGLGQRKDLFAFGALLLCPTQQGHHPASGDLAHLSPLGWEHINLTGDYHWDTSPKKISSANSYQGIIEPCWNAAYVPAWAIHLLFRLLMTTSPSVKLSVG